MIPNKVLVLATSWLTLASAAPFQSTAQQTGQQPWTSSQSRDVSSQPPVFLEQPIDKSTARTPGATVSSLHYGPYHVNAMGMLSNKMEFRIQKPCTDCFIVAMQADLLASDNKTSINIDKGGWLHHMALYNTGWLATGPRDPICWLYPTRIFASGNERTPIRINGRYDFGIEVGRSDNLMMILELMNESDKAADYFVQMTYEWLPRAAARTYKAAQTAWLDVAGCWTGGETAAKTGQYELKSDPWPSTYLGRLLTATGHTHEGGQEVVVYKNGQPVCSAPQIYGNKTEYTGGMSKDKHISDTGTCLDFGEVRKGDQLMVGAKYDTTAHPLDKEMNGRGNRPIMGISVVYIGQV